MKEVLFNGVGFGKNFFLLKSIYKKLNLSHCYAIDPAQEEIYQGIRVKKKLIYNKVVLGLYPEEINTFPALDSSQLQEMLYAEVIVMKMMDRFFFQKNSYQERKWMYLQHLRYWSYFLRKYKISCFISSSCPHEIYDYIIYELCMKYKIKVITFKFVPFVKNEYYISSGYIGEDEVVKESFSKIKKNWGERKKFFLSKKYLNYWEAINRNKEMQSPLLINKKNNLNIFHKTYDFVKIFFRRLNLVKNFKIPQTLMNIERLLANRKLKKIYYKHCENPNYNCQYIYIPLHYQPELSTSPTGGFFVHQELMITMIAKNLPENIKLYVKEHPWQKECLASARSEDFYSDLRKIKNIVFIEPECNQFELIKNSLAVTTISGTAGWEALFYERPVLLFGFSYYQYADGVYRIKDNKDCKNAISEILTKKINMKEVFKKYLYALNEVSLEGFFELGRIRIAKNSKKDFEGSAEKFSNKLLNLIKIDFKYSEK